jgi:myo-inositol catabolism protein IolH
MKIALDPFMHRHLPLEELAPKAKELGYDWIELSPREDFFEWFKRPRVFPDRIRSFKQSLRDHEVGIASLLPMYRWASPDEDERRAAVENWKRAIEVAIEMEVDTMNSEFGRGPHPDKGQCCPSCHGGGAMTESAEESWWRSMEELVPIFEREGINLHIEPHPEDWVETLQPSVDFIRTINSPRVKFLYCTPHTYYFGDGIKAMLRECADVLAHVHIADTFNHRASSGLRYIINPPGSTHRVHQHLDMGQGEVPWDEVFETLGEIGFDGIMTVCVFAWEERADDSGRFNRTRIDELVAKHFK